MRTVYIYLSSAGWIWCAIAGSYLFWKLRDNLSRIARGRVEADRVVSTEAKIPHEQ